MSTAEQVVSSLRARKVEILKELETIDGALETFLDLTAVKRVDPRTKSRKPVKGFLSDETRRKISEKMKAVWALRKAQKAS